MGTQVHMQRHETLLKAQNYKLWKVKSNTVGKCRLVFFTNQVWVLHSFVEISILIPPLYLYLTLTWFILKILIWVCWAALVDQTCAPVDVTTAAPLNQTTSFSNTGRGRPPWCQGLKANCHIQKGFLKSKKYKGEMSFVNCANQTPKSVPVCNTSRSEKPQQQPVDS